VANLTNLVKTKTRQITRRQVWFGLAAGLCVLAIVVVTYVRFFVDGPLRRTVEHNVNQRLKGYTARIGVLHFHPFTLSVDLKDATIFQDAHPDPPVAHLPLLHAGVHWRALLRGRLVADFFIDAPKLNINLRQAQKEVEDKTPVTERGWQDALEEIYPLKVNVLEVRNADITYVDEGPFKPLHLSKVNFEARDIRNAQAKKTTYPSDIHLDGVVFDSGKLVMDGHADFLAKPYPGIKSDFSLQRVELDYFKPIIQRYHFAVREGILSSDGMFEYAPDVKVAYLKHVTIEEVQIEYVHQVQTATDEQAIRQQVTQKAKELHNSAEVLVRIDQVDLKNSQLAYINRATDPAYRVYFSDVNLRMDNLSNQNADGTATGKLRGKFMGSGPSVINLAWRPNTKSSDFNLSIQVDDTDMTRMNDLLRAYGNFDVAQGRFALYSEVSIRNGEIDGYVKPFFKGVTVYDSAKDADKTFLQKIREGLIGALAWVFSNKPRNEVATTISLTGKLDSPQYSNWDAFGGMLKNAFIAALRREFEGKSTLPPKNQPDKQVPQKSSPAPLAS
jgi:Domain of Unknown Function (DUF748)